MLKKLPCLLLMVVVLTGSQEIWAEPTDTELRLQALEEKSAIKEEEDKTRMQVFYNKGLKMMTADKHFKFQIGGRTMVDFAFFNPDATYIAAHGNEENGAEFRSARIFMAGLLYNTIGFKVQYDFASASHDGGGQGGKEIPNFKDVYIQLVKLPVVGNFRVGHYREPWSLEEQTSGRFITFMERSLPNAFTRGRNLGLGFFDHALDKRLTWNVGVFYDNNSESPPVTNASNGPGKVNFSGRVTGLPLYQDKGKKLVHLGFSYAHEDLGNANTFRYRSRPEAHLAANRPVDTGSEAGTNINRYAIEAAGVWGPWSVQGEWMQSKVSTPAGVPGVGYDGWYAHASYFFTGEHRKYKTKSGAFGRVSPINNFDGKGSWGAWQLALRYSTLDLNDDNSALSYRGGKIDNITVGLNWYLNPNTRFMFNYINADTESVTVPTVDAGKMDIFMSRFQVDF
jgi:phosphate-selective porin OprO/OprP